MNDQLERDLMEGVVEPHVRRVKGIRRLHRAIVLVFLLAVAIWALAVWNAKAAEPAPGVVPPEEGSPLDPALSIPFQVCAMGGMVVKPWGVSERDGVIVIECIRLAELQSVRLKEPEGWRPPPEAAMSAFCLRATGKPLAPVSPVPANSQRRFWWLGFGLFWCGSPQEAIRFDRATPGESI